MERQLPNIEIAQQYIQQINDRLLVEDDHYNSETKAYNIGTFYIHRGMGQKGVEYTIREVTSERGAYKIHGQEGMLSDQVCFYLEGFLQGHFETCTMLGYELVDNAEADGEENSEDTQEDDLAIDADEERAEG